MTHATLPSLIVICAMIGMTQPAFAQETPDAAKAAPAAATAAGAATAASAPAAATSATAPAAAASAATAPTAAAAATEAPAAPSAETMKKARQAGFRPEVSKGVTMFCKEDATLGTRFASKKCINEAQLASILATYQQQRDNLEKPTSCVAGCGSK